MWRLTLITKALENGLKEAVDWYWMNLKSKT